MRKAIMKKILVVVLIFTMVLSLAGCGVRDLELYKAMEKMQDITSLESESKMTFEMSGQDFDEGSQIMLDQITKVLSGIEIVSKQKSIGNEEKTQAKAHGMTSVSLDGITINTEAWTFVDADTLEIKMITKLPTMIGALVGLDKEYLVFDYQKLIDMAELEEEDFNFEEIMEVQKDFQPKMEKLQELSKEIFKDLKFDYEIVKLKEEKLVDGEKVKVYQLKLDDDGLKLLVKDFVNNMLENERFKEFMIEYMDVVMEMSVEMMNLQNFQGKESQDFEEEIEEMKSQVKTVKEEMDDYLKEFKEEFNKAMEIFKDLKILGQEGILVEYSVNKAGYIVEKNSTIKLRLDLEEIDKVMKASMEKMNQADEDKDDEDEDKDYKEDKAQEISEELMEFKKPFEMKGILKFTMKINTKNTNINSQDIKIEMPELSQENSIDLMDLMEAQMKNFAVEFEGIESMENMEDLSEEELKELEKILEEIED